jgi:hypothetical protein
MYNLRILSIPFHIVSSRRTLMGGDMNLVGMLDVASLRHISAKGKIELGLGRGVDGRII